MEFRRRRKIRSLMSIAPLIDCVFLLLIFFLLTSSFIEQAGIEIQLPESAYASVLEEKEIVILISAEGALQVNGEQVGPEGLSVRVAALREELRTERALIRADKDVRLELLTKIMDAVKSAGIGTLNIQAVPTGPAGARTNGPSARGR